MSSKLYWDEKIETLPREDLEKYQTEQLSKHLELAYNNSGYYHEAFDNAGVKPSDFKQLSDLAKFPFVH